MNTLISYSGINTKVKAMSQRLLSKNDIQQIISLESVPDFIAFLKKHPGYHDLFQKYDEREVHRGEAERVFINALYLDYTKIYYFASDKQRKDLELIFFRYEVNVLKACIRLIHTNEKYYDLSLFNQFFTKHSPIDLAKLTASRSMEEYISNLKGTQYYELLTKLNSKTGLSSFDYEMALDIYYFTKSWRLKEKALRGNNRKAFTFRLGKEIDLLNIMWIYRSKRMYDMSAADILTYLIPVNYKLTAQELSRLISAVTLDEFLHLLLTTKYKNFVAFLKDGTIEYEYDSIINKIFHYNMKKYPASMTAVNYYLYRKDKEIGLLTTALECIRYGLDIKKKQEYLQMH